MSLSKAFGAKADIRPSVGYGTASAVVQIS